MVQTSTGSEMHTQLDSGPDDRNGCQVTHGIDGVAEVQLPAARLSLPQSMALAERIRQVSAAAQWRIIVLTAAGADFCLGRDSSQDQREGLDAAGIREKILEPLLDLYAAIEESPIPVVAVVKGQANGLGCALVACCDLAWAESGASFSLPEIHHGFAPLLAMSAFHGRVLPGALRQLVYTGAAIDVQQAAAIGLVTQWIDTADPAAMVVAQLTDMARQRRSTLVAVKAFQKATRGVDGVAVRRTAAAELALLRRG